MNQVLAANAAWGRQLYKLGAPQPANLSSAIGYIRARMDDLGSLGLRFNRSQRKKGLLMPGYLTMTSKLSKISQKMVRKFQYIEGIKGKKW